MSSRPIMRCAAVLTLLTASALGTLGAQAYNYPALQTPRASERDYTAAIAGGSGTTALFQWREGAGVGMHLGLDAGIVDRKGSDDLLLLVGGSLGKELLRAQGDQPLDVLLTGGLGVVFGGGTTLFRVPIGASVGHTFDLEQGMSLTPFVHPRLSIDICDCGSGDNESEVSLSFDLGASFQVNRQFALRVAASFSGSDFFDDESFGVGFNWTPVALNRSRLRR